MGVLLDVLLGVLLDVLLGVLLDVLLGVGLRVSSEDVVVPSVVRLVSRVIRARSSVWVARVALQVVCSPRRHVRRSPIGVDEGAGLAIGGWRLDAGACCERQGKQGGGESEPSDLVAARACSSGELGVVHLEIRLGATSTSAASGAKLRGGRGRCPWVRP